MCAPGNVWGRKRAIKHNSLLKGVQVRAAIRASLHVLSDLTALWRVKLLVEVVAYVVVNVDALLHE